MLKSLRLRHILSFRDAEIELGPLNVLIGPNGSGKSNLIEIFDLLRHLPRDLQEFARVSGGPQDWIWKGEPVEGEIPGVARVETVLDNPVNNASGSLLLKHTIDISAKGPYFRLNAERLEDEPSEAGDELAHVYFEVDEGFGRLIKHRLSGSNGPQVPFEDAEISPDNAQPGQSIFRERRDPDSYPAITETARLFERFRLYRDWNIGRTSAARRPQPADGSRVTLEEDFSNLALVINWLQGGELRQLLDEHLSQFYETYERVHPMVEGGSIQLTLIEKGMKSAIPASRLSDGTIRFIALLAILCNPEPPPLVCIEEPELGLHPDLMHMVAELLKTAAHRTQLIVTTHSRQLVDEFSDTPDSVVICDKDFDQSTRLRRLDKKRMSVWLEDYELGRLWEKGEIGGNRW